MTTSDFYSMAPMMTSTAPSAKTQEHVLSGMHELPKVAKVHTYTVLHVEALPLSCISMR